MFGSWASKWALDTSSSSIQSQDIIAQTKNLFREIVNNQQTKYFFLPNRSIYELLLQFESNIVNF